MFDILIYYIEFIPLGFANSLFFLFYAYTLLFEAFSSLDSERLQEATSQLSPITISLISEVSLCYY